MSDRASALQQISEWYGSLKQVNSGFPARGTIAAALVVLEHLKEDYSLELSSHRAQGGSQIAGASASATAAILARFGETRPFLKEGGRTNRGGPGDIGKMLDALRPLCLEKDTVETRNSILEELQRFLVDKVQEWHGRQRLSFYFDPSRSGWQLIRDLLDRAREQLKEGPVAQYLVGAKLQLRFPELEISNDSYSTADDQLGRPGDFYVGDTSFHVTVTPMPAVYEKCKVNLRDGFRVYLLVPDRAVVGARQNAEAVAAGQIFVESLETFVGQNVEEMSTFNRVSLRGHFRALLETYNRRVDATETDKSLMVEIPSVLLEDK